ncbi:MAG: hypothetical protein RLZZ15_3990, partial [Verrucomicrobiota bacterium]
MRFTRLLSRALTATAFAVLLAVPTGLRAQ